QHKHDAGDFVHRFHGSPVTLIVLHRRGHAWRESTRPLPRDCKQGTRAAEHGTMAQMRVGGINRESKRRPAALALRPRYSYSVFNGNAMEHPAAGLHLPS